MQGLGVKSRVVRATFRAINPRFLGARGWKTITTATGRAAALSRGTQLQM